MGFYIQTPKNLQKAEQLVTLYNAQLIPIPTSFNDIADDKAIICVINNGPFEAAVYAYSAREFEEFARPDPRPRKWLIMEKNKAEELSGCKR